MSSFNDWDLSDLTDEEQQYFWSAIQKTEDQMDVYEMSAYNKAASRNIAGANSTGKAGFLQDPKDFQRQAAMYSVPDWDQIYETWTRCTLGSGGFTDENGTWVPGVFEGGLFYPDDRERPALLAPQGAVDSQGKAVGG